MNEQEAINRLQTGDIAGLEPLVLRYQQQALRAAYLVCRDVAMAEDVVQAGYLRVYERIAQFDSSRPFGPWFLRVVVNDALRAAQRASRSQPLPLTETSDDLLPARDPSPHELAEAADDTARLDAALAKLNPEQRAVVVLRYYVELSEAAGCRSATHST